MCVPTDGGANTKKDKNKTEEPGTLFAEEPSDDDSENEIIDAAVKKQKKKTGRDLGVWDRSLEDRAGCISLWLLSYLTPLMRLGATKVLDADDIGVPSDQDRADQAFRVVQKAWDKQAEKTKAANAVVMARYEQQLERCTTDEQRQKVKKPKLKEPSISFALFTGFGRWKIALAIFYYVLSAVLNFVPVLILNDLVRFFESGADFDNFDGYAHPWVEVTALAVVPFIVSSLQTRHQAIMAHCATFARTAVSTLLYRKSLRISAMGRAKTSTGQVVNIMSNDTAQLQRFLQFLGLTSVAPLQIIFSLILIYGQVGNATWVGVGFMIFLAPVNIFIFGTVSKMRRRVLRFSDLRVKMINEILTGIRIIKFYAWERPFGKEVSKLREEEMKALTRLAYVSAVGFSLILLSAPIIQPILVFFTYVRIQDEPLDAATAFTTVALFNIMRFPFAFMPMGLLQYIQSKVSLRRVERFLQLPELQDYVQDETEEGPASKECGSITIENGSFSWIDPSAPEIRPVQEESRRPKKKQRGPKSASADEVSDANMRQSQHSLATSVDTEGQPKVPTITLQEISCSIEAGSLVAVVGSVGSGKTSLLSAILGEMEPIEGSTVMMPRGGAERAGFVSYSAQTSWIVNDTLRGNILFGRQFEQRRYDEIVKACALVDDLSVLPAGDLTEIGERGINLSGGQKARVSLARSLYSAKTKILLMDDPLSAVDAHVGEHLFSEAIAGKVAQGITRVLVTHHVHVLPRCDKIIVMERGRIKHMGTYDDLVAQGVDFAGAVDMSKGSQVKAITDKDEDGEPQNDTDQKESLSERKKKDEMKEKGKRLVTEEEKNEGSVSGSAYVHYAAIGGWFAAFLAVLISGVGRAADIMAAFWLSIWAEDALAASKEGNPHTSGETNYYVGIYAVFGMLGVLGLTFRAVALAFHRLRASRRLHEDLTESVLQAPVSFFDVTPIGRVLNRFAADMDKIDLQLSQTLSQGLSTIFSATGAIGAITVATKGTFLLPLVPIGYLYYLIQKWFRKTSTELQRINSIANSPIFADFSQTLSGTSTIRAYGEGDRFFAQCRASFDNQNASYLLVQLTNYWLGLRLDVLGGFVGAFIAGVAVATVSSEFIPAGWLGLSLSYAIEITSVLKFGVQMFATLEADMNSVERVLHYSTNIDAEAAPVVPEKDPNAGEWPTRGQLELKNASMRYRDGPLVLKDLSLTVNGGEKVGVVGRTGSGKSSLMVALFRISEIEADNGQILIDGVDIGEIGTRTLRLNLSIIPQDPVMFSNTVRYNLDPFGTATDEELWSTLKKVQLEEMVGSLEKGLEEEVAEGGENFSQGQRQLLCIARSLLRKPKILILDEATASIDNATDATIQKMIRENFADATVLTIAHRLNTIMDSDRILVLDDGRVAEFDTPEALLSKEDGIFRTMVDKSRSAHGESE